LLLKNYNKCLALLKDEQQLHSKESIYHEILGDMSIHYPVHRDILANERKLEAANIDATVHKEKLLVFQRKKLFKEQISRKYG
jgi:hypothetical protein